MTKIKTFTGTLKEQENGINPEYSLAARQRNGGLDGKGKSRNLAYDIYGNSRWQQDAANTYVLWDQKLIEEYRKFYSQIAGGEKPQYLSPEELQIRLVRDLQHQNCGSGINGEAGNKFGGVGCQKVTDSLNAWEACFSLFKVIGGPTTVYSNFKSTYGGAWWGPDDKDDVYEDGRGWRFNSIAKVGVQFEKKGLIGDILCQAMPEGGFPNPDYKTGATSGIASQAKINPNSEYPYKAILDALGIEIKTISKIDEQSIIDGPKEEGYNKSTYQQEIFKKGSLKDVYVRNGDNFFAAGNYYEIVKRQMELELAMADMQAGMEGSKGFHKFTGAGLGYFAGWANPLVTDVYMRAFRDLIREKGNKFQNIAHIEVDFVGNYDTKKLAEIFGTPQSKTEQSIKVGNLAISGGRFGVHDKSTVDSFQETEKQKLVTSGTNASDPWAFISNENTYSSLEAAIGLTCNITTTQSGIYNTHLLSNDHHLTYDANQAKVITKVTKATASPKMQDQNWQDLLEKVQTKEQPEVKLEEAQEYLQIALNHTYFDESNQEYKAEPLNEGFGKYLISKGASLEKAAIVKWALEVKGNHVQNLSYNYNEKDHCDEAGWIVFRANIGTVQEQQIAINRSSGKCIKQSDPTQSDFTQGAIDLNPEEINNLLANNPEIQNQYQLTSQATWYNPPEINPEALDQDSFKQQLSELKSKMLKFRDLLDIRHLEETKTFSSESQDGSFTNYSVGIGKSSRAFYIQEQKHQTVRGKRAAPTVTQQNQKELSISEDGLVIGWKNQQGGVPTLLSSEDIEEANKILDSAIFATLLDKKEKAKEKKPDGITISAGNNNIGQLEELLKIINGAEYQLQHHPEKIVEFLKNRVNVEIYDNFVSLVPHHESDSKKLNALIEILGLNESKALTSQDSGDGIKIIKFNQTNSANPFISALDGFNINSDEIKSRISQTQETLTKSHPEADPKPNLSYEQWLRELYGVAIKNENTADNLRQQAVVNYCFNSKEAARKFVEKFNLQNLRQQPRNHFYDNLSGKYTLPIFPDDIKKIKTEYQKYHEQFLTKKEIDNQIQLLEQVKTSINQPPAADTSSFAQRVDHMKKLATGEEQGGFPHLSISSYKTSLDAFYALGYNDMSEQEREQFKERERWVVGGDAYSFTGLKADANWLNTIRIYYGDTAISHIQESVLADAQCQLNGIKRDDSQKRSAPGFNDAECNVQCDENFLKWKLVPKFMPQGQEIPETDTIRLEGGGMRRHSYVVEYWWKATDAQGNEIKTKKIFDPNFIAGKDNGSDVKGSEIMLWQLPGKDYFLKKQDYGSDEFVKVNEHGNEIGNEKVDEQDLETLKTANYKFYRTEYNGGAGLHWHQKPYGVKSGTAYIPYTTEIFPHHKLNSSSAELETIGQFPNQSESRDSFLVAMAEDLTSRIFAERAIKLYHRPLSIADGDNPNDMASKIGPNSPEEARQWIKWHQVINGTNDNKVDQFCRPQAIQHSGNCSEINKFYCLTGRERSDIDSLLQEWRASFVKGNDSASIKQACDEKIKELETIKKQLEEKEKRVEYQKQQEELEAKIKQEFQALELEAGSESGKISTEESKSWEEIISKQKEEVEKLILQTQQKERLAQEAKLQKLEKEALAKQQEIIKEEAGNRLEIMSSLNRLKLELEEARRKAEEEISQTIQKQAQIAQEALQQLEKEVLLAKQEEAKQETQDRQGIMDNLNRPELKLKEAESRLEKILKESQTLKSLKEEEIRSKEKLSDQLKARAAVRIQSLYRGYKVRSQQDSEPKAQQEEVSEELKNNKPGPDISEWLKNVVHPKKQAKDYENKITFELAKTSNKPSTSIRSSESVLVGTLFRNVSEDNKIGVLTLKSHGLHTEAINQQRGIGAVYEAVEEVVKSTINQVEQKGITRDDVKEFLEIMNRLSLENIRNENDVGYKAGFSAWNIQVMEELQSKYSNNQEKCGEQFRKFAVISPLIQINSKSKNLVTTVIDKETGKPKNIPARSYRIAQVAVENKEIMDRIFNDKNVQTTTELRGSR